MEDKFITSQQQPKTGIRPFLRWAGSKKQLLSILSEYWHGEYTRYVEPFAGSACLFFRLQPAKALLGDCNRELIATYREIKYRLPELIPCLEKFKNSREEYLRLREIDLSLLTASERAARFIYLNRYCFNGLYRTNRSGKFNVPYGGNKTGHLPSEDILQKCSKSLRRTSLIAADFEEVLKRVTKGDFVYLDPPFSVKAHRVFSEYNGIGFGLSDLYRLRKWMEILAKKNIAFLVSYAQCEEADILREGFYTKRVRVKRHIAGFAASRSHSDELLISSSGPK
jgi:DNA adenine methylase